MMNRISQALKADAALVSSHLEQILAPEDADFPILSEAMRYSALGGGKRIRPFLVLQFCRLYGGREETALPYACALEMIHTYSLIHDDLPCMDNDDFRRGEPTCHKKFGEAAALLAGDALLTHAFAVAAENPNASAQQNLAAVRELAVNAGPMGMIGGQQMDLLGETRPMTYEQLLKMNRLKTGCLMKTACTLGCIAAGQQDTTAAQRYAEGMGLLFQLTDDLLDAGEEEEKTTFLTFLTSEEAAAEADRLTALMIESVQSIEGSQTLCALAEYIRTRKS